MVRYAISLTFDTYNLLETYGDDFDEVYSKIATAFKRVGFKEIQRGFYLGNEKVDAVKAVMAVIKFSKEYDWFKVSLKSLKLLRIGEITDLTPALAENF